MTTHKERPPAEAEGRQDQPGGRSGHSLPARSDSAGDLASAADVYAMTTGQAHALGREWQVRGVPAFAVAIKWDNVKRKTNKRPLTQHGHHDATLDPAVLAAQFKDRRLRVGEVLGVGLVPGRAGYIVVDQDTHEGKKGPQYAANELRLPPHTYTVDTQSGGLHVWYRKRDESVTVGNSPLWAEHGIDIRADGGWVVAPGVETPWGRWHPRETAPWPPKAMLPADKWEALVGGSGAGGKAASSGGDAWRQYEPAEHDAMLPAATVEAFAFLRDRFSGVAEDATPAERGGAREAFVGRAAFYTRPGGEPYLHVTRPGKTGGTSATVGYVGPGIVHVFTSNWGTLKQSTSYSLAELHSISEQSEDEPRPEVVCLADVRSEPVAWLWPGYLPRGKIVIFDGDPSVGKSTLTMDLAARLSTGSPWPDGAQSEPGSTLLLSAEDGLADTIGPRLVAAGADLTRVRSLTGVPEGGFHIPPSLPADIPTIENVIVEHGIGLVVVDPIMAYLSAGVDSHKDQAVRLVLAALAAVAERTAAVIVLVRHLNKGGVGSNPLYRGGGSIGIVGAARAAFLVGRDPSDPDRRIVACTKSNLAPEPPSLAYRLVSAPSGCAKAQWEAGPVDVSAADLLRPAPEPDDARLGERAKTIVAYVTKHPKVGADDIAAHLDLGPNVVRAMLSRLTHSKRLRRVGRGLYEANATPNATHTEGVANVASVASDAGQDPNATDATLATRTEGVAFGVASPSADPTGGTPPLIDLTDPSRCSVGGCGGTPTSEPEAGGQNWPVCPGHGDASKLAIKGDHLIEVGP